MKTTNNTLPSAAAASTSPQDSIRSLRDSVTSATSSGAFDAGLLHDRAAVASDHVAVNIQTESTPLVATQSKDSSGRAAVSTLVGLGFGFMTATLMHELVFNPEVTQTPSQALHLKNELLRGLASAGSGAITAAITGLVTWCCTKSGETVPLEVPNNTPQASVNGDLI